MKLLPAFLGMVFALAFFSCNQPSSAKPDKDFLADDIDTSVSPAQDFFNYANGGWIKRTSIPPDESAWGVANLVQEDIYERLKKVNQKAIEDNAAHGTISQKVSDFWQSGMDTATIEKQGLSPLKENFALIDKINSTPDIMHVAATFHKKGIGCLFGEYIAQDDKNSELMAYQLFQGGVGMPKDRKSD